MKISDWFAVDPDPEPTKITASKHYATADICPADTDPLPMIEDMRAKGWTLVTAYPFNGAWRVRFVFRRSTEYEGNRYPAQPEGGAR